MAPLNQVGTTAAPQPNHLPALQDYHRWKRESTITCEVMDEGGKTAAGQFIPRSAVKTKFGPEDNTFVRELCEAVFQTNRHRADAALIAESCATVFCILLELNQGKYILEFLNNADLHDSRLPFDVCPEDFPVTNDFSFEDFKSKQWEFYPATMKFATGTKFKDNRILPFITRERIAEGGSATIDKIRVHEEYDQLFRRTEQGKSLSPDHCYALKTYYGPQAKQYYEREVDAFKRLLENETILPSPFMIGFHGSYMHQGTFNVLLEFADGGTLEDYFKREIPPRDGTDIIAFWRNLLQIPKAMFRLHEQSLHENDPECKTILQGWHQDIKPANILVIRNNNTSPYHWTFKLADLGLTHFKAISAAASEAASLNTFGTRTYGAPECYGWSEFSERTRQRIKRSTDVWSFGCVCSEVVVWVVNGLDGKDGLYDFRRQRMEDVDRIEGFKGGNSFHNGIELRASVKDIHGRVRDNIRNGDRITHRVLTRLVEPMLRQKGSTRPSANMLDYEAEQAVKSAEGNLPANGGARSAPPAAPSGAIFPPPVEEGRQVAETHVGQRSNESELSNTGTFFPDEARKTESPQTTFTEAFYHGTGAGKRTAVLNRNDMIQGTRALPTGSAGATSQPLEHHEGEYSHVRRRNTERPRGTMRPLSEDEHGSTLEHFETVIPIQTKPMAHPPRKRTLTPTSPPTTASSSPHSRDRPSPGRHLTFKTADEYAVDDQSIGSRPSSRVTKDEEYARELQAHYDLEGEGDATLQRRDTKREGETIVYRQKSLKGSRTTPSTKVIYRQPIPWLSVANAIDYRKSRRRHALDNSGYMWLLNNRDHLFLVDDGFNMKPYWSELVALLGALAYITKECDDDGVELWFMNDRRKRKSKDTSPLMTLLEDVEPADTVDASIRLGEILNRYQGKISTAPPPKTKSKIKLPSILRPSAMRNAESLRPLSIYVMTTGMWQPGCQLDGLIAGLVNKLITCNIPTSPIGIQFIRFGNFTAGKDRLEHLDDGLDLALDIIDTEPSNGNVWKMLLGAVNPWFDDPESHVEAPLTSGPSR